MSDILNEAFLIEIFGLLGGGLIAVGFIPQAIKTIRTKDTSSLSLGMYILYNLGCVCWLIYGVLIGSLSVMLWNVITLVFSLTILALKIKYG